MNRDVAILILLGALLAIVLLCIGTGAQDAPLPVEKDLPAARVKRPAAVSEKGIAWSNWQTRKQPESDDTAGALSFDPPPGGDIPAEVSERLARTYQGMDVYISRGKRE